MDDMRKNDPRQGFINDRIIGGKIASSGGLPGAPNGLERDAKKPSTAAAKPGATMEIPPGSAAWERRLSDVFRARQDLAARMSRLLALLEAEEQGDEARRNVRNEAVGFLRDRIGKLGESEEPSSGLELHRYIRELEHLRLEFFQYAAQLGKNCDLGEGARGSVRTSFADMADMKFRTLLRFAFIWSLPLLATLLLGAILVGLAVLLAMRA